MATCRGTGQLKGSAPSVPHLVVGLRKPVAPAPHRSGPLAAAADHRWPHRMREAIEWHSVRGKNRHPAAEHRRLDLLRPIEAAIHHGIVGKTSFAARRRSGDNSLAVRWLIARQPDDTFGVIFLMRGRNDGLIGNDVLNGEAFPCCLGNLASLQLLAPGADGTPRRAHRRYAHQDRSKCRSHRERFVARSACHSNRRYRANGRHFA